MPCRPLTDTIEWLARDQQIPQQHEQGYGRGDPSTAILTGKVVVEELAQAESAEKMLQDGKGGDPPRVKCTPACVGTGCLTRSSSSLSIGHPCCPPRGFTTPKVMAAAGPNRPLRETV
jgi:hypothetical protein